MMGSVNLECEPLTSQGFAPFGDVIETDGAKHFGINANMIERFHDLATVDIGVKDDGRPIISIGQCNQETSFPIAVAFVERHQKGTQAFIPMSKTPIVVVVAEPGDDVNPAKLKAFISNGKQGVNYHKGVWHLPLIALATGQQFLIVDRAGPGDNCDEFHFSDVEVTLSA